MILNRGKWGLQSSIEKIRAHFFKWQTRVIDPHLAPILYPNPATY